MRVFFSYAREDGDFARRLASDLRSAGANLWIDQLDIRPGEHWDSAIEAALKECPAFLIILSPQSVASQNVKDEVHFALEEGKKILPVMAEKCELPFRLRRLQYVDFTADYRAALDLCTAHLASLFGGAASIRSRATPASAATRKVLHERYPNPVHINSTERLDGKLILWVDDRPSNNRYERKTLEDLGARVHLAIDTSDAMLIVEEYPFDFVISDMGRPSSSHAGYELLKELIRRNMKAPFFIYAGSRAPRYVAEARRLGALGCTNNPYELLEVVLTSLLARSEQQ